MKTKAIVIRNAEMEETLKGALGNLYEVIRGRTDFKIILWSREIDVVCTLMDIPLTTISIDTEIFFVDCPNPYKDQE